MRRRHEAIWSPALGRHVKVLAFGHYGTPLIAFPSGLGNYHDFENFGMIESVAGLIEAGRLKVYCPESNDGEAWLSDHWDLNQRTYRHRCYEDFFVNNLAAAIKFDCGSPHIKIGLTGCSWGAYHACNFALKFPHIFNYALCMSGRYHLGRTLEGRWNEDVYFNDPFAYVPNLHGDALNHVRWNTHINLVVGQGAHENNCIPETHQMADLLASKGISHERNIWGFDSEHHWYWWRKQIATYMYRSLG